jgi:hypothetical protein
MLRKKLEEGTLDMISGENLPSHGAQKGIFHMNDAGLPGDKFIVSVHDNS